MGNEILHRKFVFFGGKGGTGKTTCAASFALCLARKGSGTLVVSTDPAHSLSDIFGCKIGSHERRITEHLWGIEIDPAQEAQRYMKRIKDAMSQVVSGVIVDEIRRQIDVAYLSPGAEESAIFDTFIELMERADQPYERIVFDTAPTGHTLRLLTLPELLGGWIDRLIQKRKQATALMKIAARFDERLRDKTERDPVIRMLEKRKQKFERARQFLVDRQMASFVFVLDAEKLSILETQRAIELLRRHGISVDGIIVNRMIPTSEDAFLKKRKEVQNGYLETIHRTFKELVLGHIPLFDRDIQRWEDLERVGRLFDRFCEL